MLRLLFIFLVGVFVLLADGAGPPWTQPEALEYCEQLQDLYQAIDDDLQVFQPYGVDRYDGACPEVRGHARLHTVYPILCPPDEHYTTLAFHCVACRTTMAQSINKVGLGERSLG